MRGQFAQLNDMMQVANALQAEHQRINTPPTSKTTRPLPEEPGEPSFADVRIVSEDHIVVTRVSDVPYGNQLLLGMNANNLLDKAKWEWTFRKDLYPFVHVRRVV